MGFVLYLGMRITGSDFVHVFISRKCLTTGVSEVTYDDKGTLKQCLNEIRFMRQHGELDGVNWIDYVTSDGRCKRYIVVGWDKTLRRSPDFPNGAPRFTAKHMAAVEELA